MAIPLKNGADLYNFEVLRMRFHNLGADPTSDFGVGQVYFNTSTSEGSGKRVRIYDGSAFRSLAYFDEIDNRLKLLEGEIDTDAIISNMKEVSAFLAGFAEDASLMDVLNGKLDKDGGKAKNLAIVGSGTSYLAFESTDGTSYGSLGISSAHEAKFWDGSGAYTLLHSGNVGEYKAGDSDMLGGLAASRYFVRNSVITSDKQDPDTWDVFGFARLANNGGDYLNWPDAYGYVLNYKGHESYRAGFQLFAKASGNVLLFRRHWDSWGDWKTIAFMDSNVASAQALVHSNGTVGLTVGSLGGLCLGSKGIWSEDGTKNLFEYSNNTLWLGYSLREDGETKLYGSPVGIYTGNSCRLLINSSGNVTIGASDLAGTDYKLFVHGDTKFISDKNSDKLYTRISQSGIQVGRTTANYTGGYNGGLTYGEDDTVLGYIAGVFNNKDDDSTHFFYGGPAESAVLNIKNNNILIGTTNDNEKDHKLQVNGTSCFNKTVFKKTSSLYRIVVANSGDSLIFGDDASITYFRGSEMAFQNKTGGKRAMTMLWNDGDPRVGIGTSTPTEKLHVVGNLLVEGNIIATGEVSAGGAGEEGDTGTGTGGGDALIYSQEFTPTTTSITITHNLSATKGVIVQVWEKNGNYWDMVLVDVEEVDTNTVTLFFGKTETTVHKVVIMG